jgi:glycosyltransferase involved in cell wall biosynthesis
VPRLTPAISVLLPARDAEATLERAVFSLLAQTFRDFELLALDDGSKDGTRAVLERLARGDARMRVLDARGGGLVHALSLGLSQAQAPLVARMDADDESLPERFALQVAALAADGSLAGVGTQVEMFREDRPVSPNLQAYAAWLSSLVTPELLFRDRLVESPLCHPSVMLRREAIERAGGWREGDFPEDWDLWLRLLESGERLSVVPQLLHRWRDHDARLTRTDARYHLASHARLRARVLLERFAGVELTVWGAGQVGLELTRLLRAGGAKLARLVDISPRKVGQKIEGLPVIAPESLGPPRGHLIAAVGAKGARAEIRTHLERAGWVEGRDFTCAA